MKRSRGFTLIELLMVIAIISLLASVVLVFGDQARVTARNAQRSQIVQDYRVALELAYDANGTFPSTYTYAGLIACLGVYSTGHCWSNPFSTQTALTAAVAPYVPSPAPMPNPGSDTRTGLIYYSPYASIGTDYCMYWILEGTNRDCTPGDPVSSDSGGNTYCKFERVPGQLSC